MREGTVPGHSDEMREKEARDGEIISAGFVWIGIDRLRAQASGLELQVATAHDAVVEAREPIVQDMLENLAGELFLKESEAASLRARLHGFSMCSNGPVPQKLPRAAIDLLRNPPRNATPLQINTPAYFTAGREKQAFQDWKRALESDAQAQLNLN